MASSGFGSSIEDGSIDTKDLAKHALNGREIKNAVSSRERFYNNTFLFRSQWSTHLVLPYLVFYFFLDSSWNGPGRRRWPSSLAKVPRGDG